MGRYAAAYGLLGYVTTVLVGLFHDRPLADLLSAAIFYGVVCSLGGLLVGLGARRLVNEIPLPDPAEELRSEEQERRFAEYTWVTRGENLREQGKRAVADEDPDRTTSTSDLVSRIVEATGDASRREFWSLSASYLGRVDIERALAELSARPTLEAGVGRGREFQSILEEIGREKGIRLVPPGTSEEGGVSVSSMTRKRAASASPSSWSAPE